MFLFAVYYLIEGTVSYNSVSGLDERNYEFTCKRAAMQKFDRGRGEVFKRTPVEFDPLENQQCYIVVAFFDKEDVSNRYIFKNQPKIVGIFSNEQKAKDEKDNIISGGFKTLREKKENFVNCEIYPALITQN